MREAPLDARVAGRLMQLDVFRLADVLRLTSQGVLRLMGRADVLRLASEAVADVWRLGPTQYGEGASHGDIFGGKWRRNSTFRAGKNDPIRNIYRGNLTQLDIQHGHRQLNPTFRAKGNDSTRHLQREIPPRAVGGADVWRRVGGRGRARVEIGRAHV